MELAVSELQINKVCDYTYELATMISAFWNNCKVHGSEEEQSRVLLLDACRKVMSKAFDLLGMQKIDKI